ncbi:MAG: phosphatase PAP2 family protein [Actinobacteria bacterium]|nr:phosphatase PAP2 family protein [Actinomycetota bacterium]
MDDRLFRWINSFADATPWLHGVARFYAVDAVAVFALLLLAAWWDARSAEDPPRAVAAVLWAGIAPLVGAVAVQLIGSTIDRARPTTALHGTHLLLDPTRDFSFPSDHTTATVAVAVGLILAGPMLRRHWYGWTALALAILLGIVRIYVGAHYPTDVLAGIVLGTAVAAIPAIPARSALSALTRSMSRSPLRPLVASGAPVTGPG